MDISRIGIVGSSGFIGQNLQRYAAHAGLDVVAFSRPNSPRSQSIVPNVRFADLDLTDADAVVKAFDGLQCIINLQNSASPALSNVEDVISNDVLLHARAFTAAANAGVQRYVFISSAGTVYGRPKSLPVNESSELCPTNIYGATKLAIEGYVSAMSSLSGVSSIVLRVSNAYGAGQPYKRGQGLIPFLMTQIANGRPISVLGDPNVVRDYVYVDDVCSAIVASINTVLHNFQAINIASGEGHSISQIISCVSELMGKMAQIEYLPARQGDVGSIYFDRQRAMTVLGWSPTVSLYEGLTKAVAHFLGSESLDSQLART